MEAYEMSGCVAPHTLNLGCFSPQGKGPHNPLNWRLVGNSSWSGSLYMLAKMLPK